MLSLHDALPIAGKHYTQFPDASTFRIGLDQLSSAALRDRLRLIWTEPSALDPARLAARVTREIADRLARLAKSRSEEPTSELQSLMRISYAVFCLKKKHTINSETDIHNT